MNALDRYRANVRSILDKIPPPPGAWPTITVPAISIRHLSAVTLVWMHQGLAANSLDFMAAPHDNGWFLVAPASEDHLEALPEDLRGLFKAASHHATHGWILLDADGDVVEGLPLYKD